MVSMDTVTGGQLLQPIVDLNLRVPSTGEGSCSQGRSLSQSLCVLLILAGTSFSDFIWSGGGGEVGLTNTHTHA